MRMSVRVLASAVSLAAAVGVLAAEQAAAPTANAGLLSGANTTDPAAHFYIDTSGLDFRTSPPTRDPLNPQYPRATELPDGEVPPIDSDGPSTSAGAR